MVEGQTMVDTESLLNYHLKGKHCMKTRSHLSFATPIQFMQFKLSEQIAYTTADLWVNPVDDHIWIEPNRVGSDSIKIPLEQITSIVRKLPDKYQIIGFIRAALKEEN